MAAGDRGSPPANYRSPPVEARWVAGTDSAITDAGSAVIVTRSLLKQRANP